MGFSSQKPLDTGATDMASLAVFIGIDYHQNSIQVCVMDQNAKVLGNQSMPSDVRCVQNYLKNWIGQNLRVERVAVEMCCGAATFVDKLKAETHWNVQLAHAGFVSRMKQTRQKSDHADALVLADLARVDYVPQVWLAPEEIRQLRHLVRLRDQHVKYRTAAKLRIRALLREQRLRSPEKPWTKSWFHWLKSTDEIAKPSHFILKDHLETIEYHTKKIQSVEKFLTEITQDDLVTKKLLQQPGVGPVTAWTLRAEIGDFDRFANGKQLASFCGLAPCNISSGEKQSTSGLIRSGNRILRKTLIEAAHRLARHEVRWRTFYQHLVEEKHKPKCVAAAAIANRWMRCLFHEMKTPLAVAA